ncbi:Asp/Glu racemase [Alkaliphilus metalliredigens QYMF]|uniref:Asp/Glu racemase n=1 Tax=Alkaliphilus metalliredigens (strain QYMF) TaxID=293826 RepID=A6TMI5_ALKMQ|nr:aspartate/glutamate racemase family protein [Alkaliphilus metalliredigens]ABR47403.1 Asp/Glu racemase [Alkaliphilus metalliredigens QYMF]
MSDFSYGGRAKIGLIYPAPGWVMEPEFYLMAPWGVSTYTTRISLKHVNVAELRKLGDQSVEAAELLAQAPLDVIALGCTSGSFVNGSRYDQELIEKMEGVSGGIPCTTTSTAVVAALKALHVTKIAVATPYIDEVNLKAKNFLEAEGLDVVNIKGLGLLQDIEIDRQDMETVYRLAKEVDHVEAQAIVILCTGLRSVPIIEALENDLGKPVISAIQATFWHCLRLSGVRENVEGYGSLLRIEGL